MTNFLKRSYLAIIAILVAAILAGLLLFWLYSGSFTSAKQGVFRAIHLPIGKVDGSFITLNEIDQRTALASEIAGGTNPAGNAQLRSQVLQAIIEERGVATLAASKNVTASGAQVQEEFDAIVSRAAASDMARFTELVSNSFGMTPAEFRSRVVTPQVLSTNLHIWYNGQAGLNSEAFQRLDQVKGELVRGIPFPDVVKKYSDDQATKSFAGDAGTVDLSGLLPELKAELASSKPGDIVYVTSRYGQHVIKVLEREGDQVHAQTLFIQESGYDNWFLNEVRGVPRHMYVQLN